MQRIKEFFKDLWKVLILPEMLILPGNLAFFLILSIVPIITVFGMVASMFSLSTDSITNFIGDIIPSGVMDILTSFISNGRLNAGNIIFVLIGFFVASNGPNSLIIASNTLYKKENKNAIFRKIKAIFMTFWLMILFIFILIVMAFGTFILTKILSFGPLGEFIINNYIIITIVKYLTAFMIIFLTIKILYTMAPDIKLKSKYVNRGAIIATIAIILITSLYSFYAINFANYDLIYGSLANIAILLLLVYIISHIIVLGIAINHNYYEFSHNENKKK